MTNGVRRPNHSVQGLFVFVLLGLFAVMGTLIVLFGAKFYRHTVERSAYNNDYRVLTAYVRSMIQAEDAAYSLSVEEIDDIRMLTMSEIIDDEEYVTRIYAYNGSLYEQFTGLTDDFNPDDGTEICAAASFDAEINDQLVKVTMTDAHGREYNVQVALNCVQ